MNFDNNAVANEGDKFATSTTGLRRLVNVWIYQLHKQLGNEKLPFDQIEWSASRLMTEYYVTFTYQGELAQVSTDPNERIEAIEKLCKALAGPEGTKLAKWFEERGSERQKWTKGFYAFQKAAKANFSLYDPTNPMDRKILEGISHCIKPDPHDTID